MAGFGAKYIKFNPIKETPKNALPVYEDTEPVELGQLGEGGSVHPNGVGRAVRGRRAGGERG